MEKAKKPYYKVDFVNLHFPKPKNTYDLFDSQAKCDDASVFHPTFTTINSSVVRSLVEGHALMTVAVDIINRLL